MVSVAEQFGNLRDTLGSVLGIFAIMRWLRTLFAKLTGRPPPADAAALTPSAFAAFSGSGSGPATLPDGSPAPPRPSRKPFFFFLAAVFGLPYLMGKLIRALARSQEQEARRQQELALGPNGQPQQGQGQGQSGLDPATVDFYRVLYDYTPEPQAQAAGIDLSVKKDDLVGVLSRSDPMGNPSEWWRCRARDGTVGYLPSPYLERIQRDHQQQAITAAKSDGLPWQSNTNTRFGAQEAMTQPDGNNNAVMAEKPELRGKMGDITPESFQKSTFYP